MLRGAWVIVFALLCPVYLLYTNVSVASQRVGTNLCRSATHIVIGQLVSKESFERLNNRGGLDIYTRHHFRLQRVVLGPQMTELDYVSAGGSYGGKTAIVGGAPRFTLNSTYVLFLSDIGELLPSEYEKEFSFMHRDHLLVPPDLPLPDEATLQALWQNLCTTHPEGVTPEMLRLRPEQGPQQRPPLELNPEGEKSAQ